MYSTPARFLLILYDNLPTKDYLPLGVVDLRAGDTVMLDHKI